MSYSAVNDLLCDCGPMTVSWRVWPIIIYAIKRVTTFIRTYGPIKELLKILCPFLANSYTACSVPLIGAIGWIIAPSHHVSISISHFTSKRPKLSWGFIGAALFTTVNLLLFGGLEEPAAAWAGFGVMGATVSTHR